VGLANCIMYGGRDNQAVPAGSPARFAFSNYADNDLSDLTPVLNVFCTQHDDCRKQIRIKDW
jgi:hypothetical protein